MAKGEVTKADLFETIVSINKEQQEARHGQNNLIQIALTKSDEALTENKLLNQSFTNMNRQIQELKDETKEGFNDIKKLIEHLEFQFASKKDLENHTKDYDGFKKVIYGFAGFFILGILTYIGNTLWQIIINSK